MPGDENYESTARSDAAAAGYVRTSESRWDTSLNMSTTPQSAIDNWGVPASPAPVQGGTGDDSNADSSKAASSATPEK